MIKIKNYIFVSSEHMEFVIMRMRNHMNLLDKSYTFIMVCGTGFHEDRSCNQECCNPNCSGSYINKEIGPNDLNLMQLFSRKIHII